MNEMIELGEKYLLNTYNRFPVVFEKGKGVRLYDTDGKEYLDFYSGIGVMALGYGHPVYTKALHEQIDKIMHTSNLFYSEPAVKAAESFTKIAGMDRVFFTNSGAEAIEGSLKLARKYAYDKGEKDRTEIIAINHSFHGRSIGAVSVTGTEAYRTPFGPLLGDVKFAEFNSLESVKSLVSDKTCAVIMETLQGEGGINVATQEFIKGVRKVCDDNDIVLILDEVQCGMGRTGKMFAFQNYGIEPDVVTAAKGIGNGVPVGAFACKEKFAALKAGDHGTTYGGNPFVTAAVNTVIDIYKNENILENVNTVGSYLYEQLDKIMVKHDCITGHRGMGLMQGLVLDGDVKPVLNKALDNGLVLISAAGSVIRFLPPLVITRDDVDEMITKLDKSLT